LSSQLAGSGWAATAGSVASPSRRCSTLYSWPRRSLTRWLSWGSFLARSRQPVEACTAASADLVLGRVWRRSG